MTTHQKWILATAIASSLCAAGMVFMGSMNGLNLLVIIVHAILSLTIAYSKLAKLPRCFSIMALGIVAVAAVILIEKSLLIPVFVINAGFSYADFSIWQGENDREAEASATGAV